ncbi:MAG: hypothetical protein ACI85N_001926 [Gammaproteobacteria bacterium]|jgi:hypothetical protein
MHIKNEHVLLLKKSSHRISLILAGLLCIALFLLGRTELAIGLAKAPYDLLLHAAFFGLLALLIWYGSVYKIWLSFILVSTLTIADELIQLGLPGRVGSEKDIMAGIIGAIIVLTLSSLIKAIISKQA